MNETKKNHIYTQPLQFTLEVSRQKTHSNMDNNSHDKSALDLLMVPPPKPKKPAIYMPQNSSK